MKKQTTITLDTELLTLAKIKASKEDTSLSSLMDTAIRKYKTVYIIPPSVSDNIVHNNEYIKVRSGIKWQLSDIKKLSIECTPSCSQVLFWNKYECYSIAKYFATSAEAIAYCKEIIGKIHKLGE